MSEHSAEVIESASSSAGSIVAKTAASGSSLGVPAAVPLPFDGFSMQTPLLFNLSLGDFCQLVGTAYIIGLVIVALTKKYKAYKKVNDELYKSSLMGGSGGDGP